MENISRQKERGLLFEEQDIREVHVREEEEEQKCVLLSLIDVNLRINMIIIIRDTSNMIDTISG